MVFWLLLASGKAYSRAVALLRVAPFYEDAQIIQDSRIEGLHKNIGLTGNPDDTEWSIKP